MAERFAIIIDGTAALPAEVERELDIRWLPLHVTFGAEDYTAGVDLTTEQFYERIKAPDAKPVTSQPSIGECLDVYQAAIRDGHRALLVLTIATELSGTYSVAATTAQQVGEATVEVVDTRSTAGGISLIATACARARRDGRSFQETLALARRLAGKVHIIAAADVLEYLRRSGRISGGQALFGSLLSLKPILEVADGRVEPIDKVRTREKAIARLKEIIASRIPAGSRIHACTLHTNDPERARALGEWAERTFHCVEYWTTEAGPVIGARGGPGVIGLCWYRAEDAGA
ncbi:MAG: DegV family protein [Candidatus Limnocylindria bacterium]